MTHAPVRLQEDFQPTHSILESTRSLLDLITGSWASQVVHAAAKLKLADELASRPRTVREIAAAVGAMERPLYRLLRAMSGLGLTEEDSQGRFDLTPTGQLLRSDVPNSLHGFAALNGEDWHWRNWGGIVDCVKNGGPVFDRLFGMPVFAYLGQHPEAGAAFDAAMTSITGGWNSAVLAALEFPETATVVDIGGGAGVLLAAILEANPHLHGVLVDLPEVTERAVSNPRLAAAISTGRCKVSSGSFFEPIPAKGDIHIMKFILHDWGDEEASTILTNSRNALETGDRLVLVEQLIEPGKPALLATLTDIEMLLFVSGGERTEQEFAQLLRRNGFELTKVVPTPAPVFIIEARAI
ncbi:methyltransferase [Mesorhizobium amorphae]